MNKIMLASLMILIAGPVHAMDDDPDKKDVELGIIPSDHSDTTYNSRYHGKSVYRPVTPDTIYDTDDANSTESTIYTDRENGNRNPVINVQVPTQDNTALNAHLYGIGDKLGNVKSALEGIRNSKFVEQLARPFQTIALIFMICSAGQGIQDAISSVGNNLNSSIYSLKPACQCQCSCPTCPSMPDFAPAPMQMTYNGTTNSTTSSNSFFTMINNMTKQKTD